jgi:hypothetical protein
VRQTEIPREYGYQFVFAMSCRPSASIEGAHGSRSLNAHVDRTRPIRHRAVNSRTGQQPHQLTAVPATGRHCGRSWLTCPRTAAGPSSRAWAGRPARARPRPGAAGRAGGPGRPRLRPPRSAPATPRPIRGAGLPGPPTRGPAACPSCTSAVSIASAVCDPLCGSIPIITAATSRIRSSVMLGQVVTAAGISNSGSVRRSHLFRATPRQGPASWRFVRKPSRERAAGRAFESQPARPPERYGIHPQRLSSFN